ncbi:MAG: SDR family oxidoreductase [Bacteroidota bacterium]
MKLSSKEKARLKNQYGPWAVITGASSGIGQELAHQLASSGLHLVLVARNETKLQSLAKTYQAQYGVQCQVVAADLGRSEGIEQVKLQTADKTVGLLIASAGYGTSGVFDQSEIEDEINMLRVNCEALMVMTHHFAGRFVKQERGGIILLSSMVAFQGVPYSAHYSATKAYVQSFAEGVAEELKPYKVDVLAAAPGPVKSGFEARANMKMSMALTPAQVGVPILKALGRKRTVLPGFLTKFLVYSLRTVPRWGKVKIMKLVMGGMTEHQRVSQA